MVHVLYCKRSYKHQEVKQGKNDNIEFPSFHKNFTANKRNNRLKSSFYSSNIFLMDFSLSMLFPITGH
jgi:hypothetical protein